MHFFLIITQLKCFCWWFEFSTSSLRTEMWKHRNVKTQTCVCVCVRAAVPSAAGRRAAGTSRRWRDRPRDTRPSSSLWAAGPESSSPNLQTQMAALRLWWLHFPLFFSFLQLGCEAFVFSCMSVQTLHGLLFVLSWARLLHLPSALLVPVFEALW